MKKVIKLLFSGVYRFVYSAFSEFCVIYSFVAGGVYYFFDVTPLVVCDFVCASVWHCYFMDLALGVVSEACGSLYWVCELDDVSF